MAGILSPNSGPPVLEGDFGHAIGTYQLSQVPRMKVSTGMLRLARQP